MEILGTLNEQNLEKIDTTPVFQPLFHMAAVPRSIFANKILKVHKITIGFITIFTDYKAARTICQDTAQV